MNQSPSTCWTMIRDAADGDRASRDEFARRYAPAIEAYLHARWTGDRAAQIADATQEVFVECLKGDGALERARPGSAGGFRGFLYGVTRNVARRFEERAVQQQKRDAADVELDGIAGDEASLSRVFDRAWAESIMREAARRMEQRARSEGPDAERRVEILRRRFQDGQPIRDIAPALGEEAARIHHEYARARVEFRDSLIEVMSFFHPDSPADAQREAAELASLLE